MFCNGAEEYVGEGRPWQFIHNIDGKTWRHELACLELSGYKAVIDSRAIDVYGDELPGMFAVLVPEELINDPEQIEARHKYFELDGVIRKEYEEKLIKFGVVDENYFSWKRLCYYGCEEEYGLELPEGFHNKIQL